MGDTDQLTPEAVKAALDGATPWPWDEPSIQWTVSLGFVGFNLQVRTTRKRAKHDARLIAKTPALARDWLRLKKVEEAAHRMQTAWGNSPTGSQHCSATHEMEEAIAAFRAAVEGK